MGKNDLWIASLATPVGLKLVTTDSDFHHLHNVFFEVTKINPTEFVQFFLVRRKKTWALHPLVWQGEFFKWLRETM
jgi:hypothetical protein